MARKSRDLRLSQATALKAAYAAAGLEQDRSYMFICDMVVRLGRRDITGGQKKYLDSLIDQGVPQQHNPEACVRIDEAIKVPGMEACVQPLSDFRYKLAKGWNLSEKQQAFLEGMLKQADDLRENGLPVLTDEDHETVKGLLRFSRRQSDYYWHHRPGAYRAVDAAKKFYEAHNTVTARQLKYLKSSFKGVVRRLENPRLSSGELGYVRRDAAMVMSAPYFDAVSGVLVQDVLVNGELKTVKEELLGKRRSRA